MKTTLVVVAIILAAVSSAYLVWMNRASERVVTTLLSAVVALGAVLFAVLTFGTESDQTARFPVSFFAYKSNRTPVHIPFRPDLQGFFQVAELENESPGLMQDDDLGMTLYHEFLQKAIVDALTLRYSENWSVDVVRYRISGTLQAPRPGAAIRKETLSATDIERAMTGNRFATKHSPIPRFSLPPDSELSIKPPKADGGGAQQGVIEIKNPFARITITTQPLWYAAGIGDYRLMTNLAVGEDQKLFFQCNYEIQVSAKFNRFRAGHPEMPLYKKWASQIISELRVDFDEEEILKEAKERYLFTAQAANSGAHVLSDGLTWFNPPERQ